jgi:nucleoid-associated protein YgaU
MGLFDFLKNAGKKPEKETTNAAELQKSVDMLNLGIKDFKVAFANGTATISGLAPTQKDLEIARLVVGNHEGVDKVNDDGLRLIDQPAAPTAAATPGAKAASPSRMYTVKPGDTLSKIAKQELGDASKYPQIFEANKPMLKDPDKIYPGQVLRVPQ